MRACPRCRRHRRPHLMALASLALLTELQGCASIGPMAAWEVLKFGGSSAMAALPPKPVNTVHHGDAPVKAVCVEYNRELPLDELVPALLAELKTQGVQSRVYDIGTGPRSCAYWLRYVGSIAWGVPPLGEGHRPYLSTAALSLHSADGQLLASSAYVGDDTLARWASTQKKIAPVVKALITGFTS